MFLGSGSICFWCHIYWRDGFYGRRSPAYCEGSRVCNRCRRSLHGDLATIAEQHAALDASPGIAFDCVERVSGTPEFTSGVRLEVLDQMSPASIYRYGPVQDPNGDQVGSRSAASVLHTIAASWYQHSKNGPHQQSFPPTSVLRLCRWLQDHIDAAANDFPGPAVRHSARIRVLAGLLCRLNHGGRSWPDNVLMVPCPRCDAVALFRNIGSDLVFCSNCESPGRLEDHDRWTQLL